MVIDHVIRRTITEADNVLFTSITMNPAWLHLDFDYATNESEFGRPLVNSMLTLAMLVGISVHETTLGTTVANLGFEQVDFPAPMFHGDTLYADTVVADKRESKSRPGEGIVTFVHTGRNQHGDIVATATRKAMMRKKPMEDTN